MVRVHQDSHFFKAFPIQFYYRSHKLFYSPFMNEPEPVPVVCCFLQLIAEQCKISAPREAERNVG